MQFTRLIRHLVTPPWRVARAFPPRALHAVEAEIRRCEATHSGQLRFAVEAALDFGALLRGQTARERAVELFSQLRVWDTEHNNGVLIYVLLADHDVEILADRGIHRRVSADEWGRICREMEHAFREGHFEQGVIAGIRSVESLLARHFPHKGPSGPNELPDSPVVL